jgi:alpha-tubulin suppressor-like RCC1 family protein
MALERDGTVVAWGDNFYGETNVPTGLTDAVAIAAGTGFSLALERDGTVVAWGYDAQGEIDVPARLSGVVAISAGWFHSLELASQAAN